MDTETTSPTSENFQRIAYDRAYGESQAVPFPDHKVEGSLAIKGELIVSLGGGTGADVAHLASRNEVHVIDFSEAPRRAAEAFGIQFQTADFNRPDFRIPFPDQSIRVLVAKDILEHLEAPERLMAEARRTLKPGGHLVLSIPNHFNLWGRLRILLGGNLVWKGILHDHTRAYDEWNYMHVRFFTWAGLKRFVKRSGFQITRTFFDFGPFGHYFSIPMLAEHLEIKREKGTLTPKGRVFLRFAHPLYRIADMMLPPRARNGLCSLAPGALTSCFFIHAQVKGDDASQ